MSNEDSEGEGDVSSFGALCTVAAKTNSHVKQGLISMTGTFMDTIIICTMTGLTLIITGIWGSSEYKGAQMTTEAFRIGFGNAPMIGQVIVTIGLIFFAFTTIIGWNYYGERCTEYLWELEELSYIEVYLLSLLHLLLNYKLWDKMQLKMCRQL